MRRDPTTATWHEGARAKERGRKRARGPSPPTASAESCSASTTKCPAVAAASVTTVGTWARGSGACATQQPLPSAGPRTATRMVFFASYELPVVPDPAWRDARVKNWNAGVRVGKTTMKSGARGDATMSRCRASSPRPRQVVHRSVAKYHTAIGSSGCDSSASCCSCEPRRAR